MAAEPLVHGIPAAIDIAPVIGIQEAHVVASFLPFGDLCESFSMPLSPQ
jgi:hypothetical protein